MPVPKLIVRVDGKIVGTRRSHRPYKFALVGTPSYEFEKQKHPNWAEARKEKGVYDRLHTLCFSVSLEGVASRKRTFVGWGYVNLSIQTVEVA